MLNKKNRAKEAATNKDALWPLSPLSVTPTPQEKSNKQFKDAQKRLRGLSLDELLQEISVMEPGLWKNKNTPTLGEWYAVATDEGIVAYFGEEAEAFGYRLNLINRILNS